MAHAKIVGIMRRLVKMGNSVLLLSGKILALKLKDYFQMDNVNLVCHILEGKMKVRHAVQINVPKHRSCYKMVHAKIVMITPEPVKIRRNACQINVLSYKNYYLTELVKTVVSIVEHKMTGKRVDQINVVID